METMKKTDPEIYNEMVKENHKEMEAMDLILKSAQDARMALALAHSEKLSAFIAGTR